MSDGQWPDWGVEAVKSGLYFGAAERGKMKNKNSQKRFTDSNPTEPCTFFQSWRK